MDNIKDNFTEPKLSYYFKNEKILTLWIVVFGILTNVLIVWIPSEQGKLLDSVLHALAMDVILVQIIFFIGLVFIVQIFRFFKRYLVRKFENRTVRKMRRKIYANIMDKEIYEFKNETAGSLMNKIIGDVNVCSEGLRKIITEIFDTGVMLMGYSIIMITYDFKITLASFLFIPVAITLSNKMKGLISVYTAAYREEKGNANELVYQNIKHALLFRMNGLEENYYKEYENELGILKKKAIKASFFDSSLEPLYNIISLIGIVFVVVMGNNNIIHNIWSIGEFSSYLIMFTSVTKKASKIATYINLWQKTNVSWARLKPYLREKSKTDDKEIKFDKPVSLKFDHVSFHYEGNEREILSNITFEAHEGEIIGICGPIASGKSTLLKLLASESNYQGSITINDYDLSKLTTHEKSQILSYKGHETELLSDTIYENIALGDEVDITDVLNHVMLNIDIQSMEENIQTQVGNNGIVLSGGQQERMSLARELCKQKKLILLDDPFAALDINTEMQIIKNLREFYKHSIVLVTSHRFELFPHIDKVMVLNTNGLVQIGSHNELLKTNREYKQIFEIQEGTDHENP